MCGAIKGRNDQVVGLGQIESAALAHGKGHP
jgi:hypothetical protein